MRALLAAALIAIAACSGPPLSNVAAATQPPTDPLANYAPVTDLADILAPDREAALARQLEALERSTQHQLVVVTVTSLGGRNIDDFTRALGNRWGVGRRGHDDGVALLVAPAERKVRIEVGRGLEAALPNSLCARIIAETMIPRFGAGDLAGGIEAGVAALIERLTRTGA